MGAWGCGVFENDSALDWLGDVIDSGSLADILIPLQQTVNSRGKKVFGVFHTKNKYIEEPLGSECLAAAEIVAVSIKRPGYNLPDELSKWVETLDLQADNSITELAITAVGIIKTDSELKDLWEESDSYTEWSEIVNDLERRLLYMS